MAAGERQSGSRRSAGERSRPCRADMLRLPHRPLQRAFLAYSRLARGMTLGVRAVLLKESEVLLVKHSYVPGWHFPGGGVEAGESAHDALVRELREEAGAELTAAPQLFALYRNGKTHPRDHVALYLCRHFELRARDPPGWEIVAAELFPLAALPEEATAGTRARLREIVGGEPPATDW
jgi:ADP-ribose pyrophosphatase YjhB (NUDIX family)